MAAQNKKLETEVREVSYAATHGPIFVPGLGQFGPTLVAGVGSTVSRIGKMYLNENTLTVMIGADEILIPLMNVTHMKMA